MDIYPKRFIQAALIYLMLAALLGVAMGVQPTLIPRVRFVHIHLNLLGFMTLFIAGVAYHVLPRFSARQLPWPEGMKHHFYLQNVGLIGMVVTHAGGAVWGIGALKFLFVAFATLAFIGLAIMFYNLYGVLKAPRAASKPTRITAEMKVSAVLDYFPAALPLFLQRGFGSLANPAARNTFARLVTLEQACRKHNVDLEGFLQELNEELFHNKAALSGKPSDEAHDPGKVIQHGEACKLDTMVGSLIKVYPSTRAVFEKHYGEGCFSCPGQVFETLEQTARMHNIDPALILKDINRAIGEELSQERN